ncbi:MAG: FtsX-like permease family protein [Gammaproteobacteria bacterium]|nr:ABC transporter permease [Gammaproteobacteria bacterium]MXW07018.1 FtsX-like permease family protein [Gammaproteobacteria bacterium]MYC26269.1 FtsX-like permease family protein [Gammaproteobacteria bacterium]
MKLLSTMWPDFRLAIGQLAHRPLRTFLTLLGMIFGVGAVISMLAVSEGGLKQSMKMIQGLGVENIIVEDLDLSTEELLEVRKHSSGLSVDDARAVKETLHFVDKWAGIKNLRVWTLFSHEDEGDSINSEVWAVSSDFFELSSLGIEVGALFTDEDNQEFATKAVLGETTARRLFPNGDAIGKPVKVNFTWFEVIGVLQDQKIPGEEIQGIKVGGDSDRVYIPLNTGLNRLKVEDMASELTEVKFKIKGESLVSAEAAIRESIKRRHGAQDDFSVTVPNDILAQQRQTNRIFTIVMTSVAIISLLVGGIGIMNIMLASVLERKSEIGLLRAVGATKADVVRQFLIETTVIAFIGAIFGIVAGVVLAILITFFAKWPVAWNYFGISVAVIVCMAIAVAFGVYPAVSAAKLDPVAALQSE